MSKFTQLPRYINAASIQIGDVIRVTWTGDDVERTIKGRVAHREYQGTDRVLTTKTGVELLRWNPARKTPRITLLDTTIEQPTMLDIFDQTGQVERV